MSTRAVTIEKPNVHGIKAGTTATLVGKAQHDGLWILDVPGRGRLSFERGEFRVCNGPDPQAATPAATPPPPAPERCPDVGTLRLGPHTVQLSVSMTDLGAAIGMPQGRLRETIRATLGEIGTRGERCNLTAAQAREIWRVAEAMLEYGVSAKPAIKILAKLDAHAKA